MYQPFFRERLAREQSANEAPHLPLQHDIPIGGRFDNDRPMLQYESDNGDFWKGKSSFAPHFAYSSVIGVLLHLEEFAFFIS